MPFKSEAQRRLLWLKHPDIAKKWSKEYPNQGKLPMHKGDKMNEKVNPATPGKKKLENYELDNHVRTLTDAHKIVSDPHVMKQVHKHAKKQKAAISAVTKMTSKDMDSPEEEASESPAIERKEVKSIADIRARSKKLKSKMSMGDE